MLYRLQNDYKKLEPIAFVDFDKHAKLEKNLENLVANHLLHTLFAGMALFPFHQERRSQPGADIYALGESGDVVIFQLKRSTASGESLDQLLGYVQEAGNWRYADIERRFRAYHREEWADAGLAQAHQEAFNLPSPLKNEDFNRQQHMFVVGSAADDSLIRAVEFWKRKGLSIDFIPYRVYEIAGSLYFEFFSKPNDVHINPGSVKGVLFDMNPSFAPDAVQHMIEKGRISAYGDRKEAVRSLQHGDYVFYCHGGVGLIAAAEICGHKVREEEPDELYWNVKFLTHVPNRFDSFPHAMSFQQAKQVTGKSFCWATTKKVPYLTREEALHLLAELKKVLAGHD